MWCPWASILRFWNALKVSLQRDKVEANSDCRNYSALPEDICRRFSLAEVKAATNNFSPDKIIGGCYFGFVYRGTVDDGYENSTMAVAVKCYRSELLPENIREFFRTEVQILCQLRHPNLVSLIGFCEEQNEMIIVYEYMSRGSLSNHLYGRGYVPLSWKQRLEICIGAAQGLHYLHTGAKYAILHGHVKSFNILLDEEMSGKLYAFGFSKIGPPSMSKASLVRRDSKVMGTYDYMAPEYILHGELTEKSEVYSFGIVLLEVLFGRRAYDAALPENQRSILDWASEYIREGTIYQVIDADLRGRIAPECFKKYLKLACSCVRHDRNERPAMGEVEVTLELALELQEKANSEPEGINPYHGECMYGELSFCTSDNYFEFDLDRYSGSGGHHILLAW